MYTRKNLTTCSKSANKQAVNNLLTTCSKLVDIVRLVTRLFQQGSYNHDITILLQPCVVNLVTLLLYHVSTTCNRSDKDLVVKLVTSC